MIEKVLDSLILQNENYFTVIKSFVIRFLGLIFKNAEGTFTYDKITPLFKDANGAIRTDHIPSIEDALLFCLSCITKQYEGALWFVKESKYCILLYFINSLSEYFKCPVIAGHFKVIFDPQCLLHLYGYKQPAFINHFKVISDHKYL